VFLFFLRIFSRGDWAIDANTAGRILLTSHHVIEGRIRKI
jgi:hypothetical protein